MLGICPKEGQEDKANQHGQEEENHDYNLAEGCLAEGFSPLGLGAVLCLPPSLLFGHDCKREGVSFERYVTKGPYASLGDAFPPID